MNSGIRSSTADTSSVTGPLRLVCFPYAGTGASMFRGWTGKLPPTVSVMPVQPPGREIRYREQPHTHIEPMIEELIQDLAGSLDAPYALYGHSVGALVAFEFARAMRRAGRSEPVHLIVSGRMAPQITESRPALRDLPLEELRGELRKLGGTPEAVLGNDDVMAALLPTLRADLSVNETYVYRDEPPLATRITAIGGTRDPRATPDEIAAWGSQTSRTFTMKLLVSGHFFVAASESELLGIIEEELAPWIS